MVQTVSPGAGPAASLDDEPTPRERMVSVVLCAVLVVVTLISIPLSRQPLGPSPVFLTGYIVAVGTTETLTAMLLWWRARLSHGARLAALSAAYAFSAPLIVANVLLLTGAIEPEAMAAPSAALWTYVIWHLGWCGWVLAYAVTPHRTTRRPSLRPAIAFVAALAALAILTLDPKLPALMSVHAVALPLAYALFAVSILIGIAALVYLVRARRQLQALELWVIPAIVAIVLDLAIVTLGTTRYSYGWYVARGLGLINGSVVLVALVVTLGRLVERGDRLAREFARQRRLEAARVATDERLRHVLETVPQIMWTATADGSIDWYNRQWHAYTGLTAEQSAGWGWQAAHHPEDFPLVMERWPHTITTGEPFEMEFRLRRHDGVFQWFLTRGVPERDAAGNVIRWYGSNTNIDAQRRELERSSRMAQVMQRAFLPDALPEIPGIALDALYLPAGSDALIGGDWYDAIALPEGRVLLTCGDVIGHGIDAAMVAARYRQSIALAVLEAADPAYVLERANRAAVLQHDAIATALVAIFDPRSGVFTYALAGHPPPVIGEPDALTLLPPDGVPLGIEASAKFATRSVALERNAVVVCYTDGLVEFNRDLIGASEVLYAATERLADGKNAVVTAQHVYDAVMHGAARRDDVAILVIHYGGSAAPRSKREPLMKHWRFHSSDAFSAQNARRTLAEFLAVHAIDESEMFDAELVIGEALANTVEHAPGLVEVTIDWSEERPQLSVRDAGKGLESEATWSMPEDFSEDGRGLFLINTLARDVQLRNAPGFGLELRCVLPTRRLLSDADACGVGAAAPPPRDDDG